MPSLFIVGEAPTTCGKILHKPVPLPPAIRKTEDNSTPVSTEALHANHIHGNSCHINNLTAISLDTKQIQAARGNFVEAYAETMSVGTILNVNKIDLTSPELLNGWLKRF